MEDIDVLGKFWLSGHQENKEFGRLRFTRQIGGELEVYSDDSSPSTLADVTSSGGSDWLIFGTSLFDLKSNKPSVRIFTLDGVALTNWNLPWGTSIGSVSAQSARLYVRSIYENMLWIEKEELTFSEATVQIRGIDEWLPSLDGISNTNAESKKHIKQKTPRAEIKDIGHIELHIPEYREYESSRDTCLATTIKLSFTKPSTFSEIIKIIGYIQSLVSLATSKFHSVESLKLKVPANSDAHMSSQESREVIAFFRPPEPSSLYSQSKSSDNHQESNYQFLYHDIEKEVGLAKWIERMESNKNEETLAISMLLKGKTWDETPLELQHFSIITAALMLAPASDNNIKKCLQSLRKELKNVLPTYIDDEWFAAVAHLRSKFIAHPKKRRGRNYPATEATLSIRLLELVCYSRIFKDILELPDSVIKRRTWENRIAEQKLNSARNCDLKEWYMASKQEDKEQ